MIRQKKTVEYELSVFVYGIGDNKSEISIGIPGWSMPCEPQQMENGWRYYCKFEPISVKVSGEGESFPFDKYTLTIPVSLSTSLFNFDHNVYVYDLSTGNHSIYFSGIDPASLEDSWKTYNGRDLPVRTTNDTVSIDFTRTEEKIVVAFLEFFVPPIACYYLLGSATVLDPKRQLAERLRIYLSIFVFVPTFFMAIQAFLPYRTMLTFPELLLVNLLVSTAVLGIFSIIGNQHQPSAGYIIDRLDLPRITERLMDGIGVIIAMFVFVGIYLVTFRDKIGPILSLLFTYVITPAYIFWIPLVNNRSYRISRKLIYALLLGIIPTIAMYLNSLLFLSVFVQIILFGGLLIGIIIGLYVRNSRRGAVLAVISGILGMFLAAIIGGLLIGGLEGIFYWSQIFGILGMFSWSYALCGAMIINFVLAIIKKWNKSVRKLFRTLPS